MYYGRHLWGGDVMGVVKYTGPVASFHCPTDAEIRSLKVHFSPKQEGSGDPSPENVRPIVGWDGVVVHNDDGNIVPEEYQKVEYIYIDSNQYIDTQYAPTISPEIRVTMEFISSGDLDYFGFANNTAPSFIVNYNLARKIWYNRWGSTSASNLQPYPDANIKYDFIFGKNTSINGVIVKTYSDYDWSANNQTLRIGGGRNLGAQLNIYTLQFYDGNLKFNLIPCRRKSDNKPGMYDTVSGEFFTNQGTGEFICGPDVGETVDYEFGVLGKNKFDYISTTFIQGIRGNDGEFISDSVSHYTEQFIPVIPATEYTLSGNNLYSGGYVVRIYYSDADKNWISKTSGDRVNVLTFTTPSDCYYIQIQTNSNGTNPETWQLEFGSTATTYEPYDSNKTVYGGWVDLISGEVQEEGINDYPYEFISLNGTEDWILVKQNEQTTIFKYYYGIGAKSEGNSICSHFRLRLPSYSNLDIPNAFVYGMSGNLFIQTDNSLASTVEEFTSYLQEQYQNNTPVNVLFQANRTNKTYSFSPYSSELTTFLGQNNVWSNADYVEVEYDLHETQEIFNRKAFIMANQPHLVTPAAAVLQSFITDVPAPLKECKIYFAPKQDLNGYDKPWPAGGGKNLFNENNMTYGLWTSSTGTVDNLASYGCMANDKIFIAAGTVLYLTIFGDELYSKAMVFYNTDGTFNSRAYSTGTTQLIYTPATDCYVAIELAQGTSTSTSITEEYVKAAKVVLSTGSAATTYEPYENICPIDGWESIEVNKCGKNFSTAATGTEMVQKWPVINSSRRLTLSGMPPGQEFTLSASFTKAYEVTTNRRLYLNGTQTTNSTTNNIFCGPSTDSSVDRVIHNWTRPNGTIEIAHNNRGLTYSDNDIEYAASLQNVQLELGDTATDYEPYNGATIPITFPSVINILTTTSITTNKTLSSTGEETSENGMSLTNYIKVNEGDTYTLTFISKEGARTRRIYGYNANKEPVESLASASWVGVDSIGTLTTTIPNGIEYIRTCYKTTDEDIFLEGPESSVIYGGYVDLVKGELVQTHICIDMYEFAQEHTKELLSDNLIRWRDPYGCNGASISTHFINNPSSNWGWMATNNGHYCQWKWGYIGLSSSTLGFTTEEEWKNWLAANNVKLIGILSTPVHYTLTPTQLKTLRGTNNIWSSANDKIEIKYWKH